VTEERVEPPRDRDKFLRENAKPPRVPRTCRCGGQVLSTEWAVTSRALVYHVCAKCSRWRIRRGFD
jgi:hypothetical protein